MISIIIRNKNESEYIGFAIQSCLDFFDKPEREKYKHLEKYETYIPKFLSFGDMEKTTVINKNFYCIEKAPKLIDIQFLDQYLEIVRKVTKDFKSKTDHQIKLY